MSHGAGLDAELFVRLCELDAQIAEAVREQGCGHCGQGRLDRADYPRKARGVPAEAEADWARRLSFCCASEGCRRRTTPPSVRFLGRRVYAAAWVVWAAASAAAATALGAPRRTVRRWSSWWRTRFPRTVLWVAERGRLSPPVEASRLPGALLNRFVGTLAQQIESLLMFVAPITTTSLPPRSARAVR